MPQLPLTVQERRLATLCRVLAVFYFGGAAVSAVLLELPAMPAGILAISMMTAVGTACLVAAARPRERRHAVLAAIVAQLTAGGLAAAHLLAGDAGSGLAFTAAVDLLLFLLTTFVYRAAAPGVHSAPARENAPPEAEEPPKVQLKVSKS